MQYQEKSAALLCDKKNPVQVTDGGSNKCDEKSASSALIRDVLITFSHFVSHSEVHVLT